MSVRPLVVAAALGLLAGQARADTLALSTDVGDYRTCVLRFVQTRDLTCGSPMELGDTRDLCGYSLSHVQAEVAEMQNSLGAGDRAVTRLVEAEEAKARTLLTRAQARHCRLGAVDAGQAEPAPAK